ncbi:hypothetical protein GpartN1_g1834.t1 [Galdieria partita]|uniref:ATP-grasp domain-containing protein n=1 Tax=Galdieria partita TaxID=83374 RepID=A0A9C7UNP1_9RHOD|nr:hypothetical protein GpartN1_g1834.t1 [Galdieria partita]
MEMNHAGIDFSLNPRRKPSSQVERIPLLDDDIHGSFDEDSKSQSLRANFLPPAFSPTKQSDIVAIDDWPMEEFTVSSPVFTNLPQIKPNHLCIASEETQRLRRKLLRGANVLIVQAGYSGKRFIYERLKELGVQIIIMDGPDSWARSLLDQGLIRDYLELDLTDYSTVFDRAMGLVNQLDYSLDGVTTYYEDAVPLAARIAYELKLMSNPVFACESARNKQKTRSCLKEKGLAVPAFHLIRTREDLPRASQVVGFPAILKPVYGAASMGVYRVNDYQHLEEEFNQLLPLMDPKKDSIWAQGTEMILEEYYDGDEFDVDLLLFGGQVVYCTISDNWACCEPWFQETGTNIPSLYPLEKQKELMYFAQQCTLALGFVLGAFHVEVKYTCRGPRLIEVNARMGGMCVRDANLVAWGVDLVEEHMMASLGIPIRPMIPREPLAYLAEAAVNAPYSGVMESDDWLQVLSDDPRTRVLRYLKKKGDMVRGPEDGMPDWIAEIICVSFVSGKDALEYMQTALCEKLRVPIIPLQGKEKKKFFFPKHSHPFTLLTYNG